MNATARKFRFSAAVLFCTLAIAMLATLTACGGENEELPDNAMGKLLPIIEYSGLQYSPTPTTTTTPAYPAQQSFDFVGDNFTTNLHGFHLYVAAGSVTPTGLRLAMVNEGAYHIGHGTRFRIEEYIGGEWAQVPFLGGQFWTLPLLIKPPQSTTEENISWEHMHGELPSGIYRVVRNFSIFSWMDNRSEHAGESADVYAVFVVSDSPQATATRKVWMAQQSALAANALARFEGLDLEITEHSPRGLTFTLANNNPTYTYIINSIFVGWEDPFPYGGTSAGVEYIIFERYGLPNPAWDSSRNLRIAPGESITHEVYWYEEIGLLGESSWRQNPPNPYIFDLVMDIRLDVSAAYVEEHFRHRIPDVPTTHYRIRTLFDIY